MAPRPGSAELRPGAQGRGRLCDPGRQESPTEGAGPARAAPGAAAGYYRDFLAQRTDDPSLMADAAAAHERIGDILIELGRYHDSLAAYDQALALVEPLVRRQPGEPVPAIAQVRPPLWSPRQGATWHRIA